MWILKSFGIGISNTISYKNVGGNSVMVEVIDIGSSSKSELGKRLSNWANYPFVFDGITCRCLEGVLQAFKFPDENEQRRSCGRTRTQNWN